MAISVRGTLIVQRKSGRKGEFNVGDLTTEIGEFEVKDALIEEFEPGRYSGHFVINWIEPDSFSWRGKVFVKNRANLDAILVDDVDETLPAAAASTPPEPDPAEHVPVAPVEAVTPPSAPASTEGEAGDADLALFGAELQALRLQAQPLKLDPTVDRQVFRAQRDRLKALGYSFDAKTQRWAPAR